VHRVLEHLPEDMTLNCEQKTSSLRHVAEYSRQNGMAGT
jgi:hypothetical protein